jgi:hypothetical protein
MHPQIRQVGPGACPICGMVLESETVTGDEGPSAELIDMTRRFWIGLALAVPVIALEMGGHLTNLHVGLGPALSSWIQLVLATPVVLWVGWPFFQRGWGSVVNRSLNMFSLIALGTGVAYVYSVVATLAPGLFPPAFRGMGGAVAVYFEAAAVITVLVLVGQVLELRARAQTGRHPRIAQPGAQDGTPADGVRYRRGNRARRRTRRRSAARAARRGGAGGRRGAGRQQQRRRGDGHRRANARDKGHRRQGDRWHRQRYRRAGDARGQGW